MHEHLIDYLSTRLSAPLTEDEKSLIRRVFVHKRLRKHQYLLQQGEVCKVAGFIVKGALKQYTVDANGKEDILALYIEHWWAGDRESFSKSIPSEYFIDAYEDTDLLVVTKPEYESSLSNQPFMADLHRILSERQALQLLKRVHATKTMTAEQRLADFEKTYPDFYSRFPQHIIASYLGMTKETLSRIRASQLKK